MRVLKSKFNNKKAGYFYVIKTKTMKTEFELDCLDGLTKTAIAKIIGERPNDKPYLMIISDKQKSVFVAVNILKALKSKKLK